eukprot:TRINITY_DN5237_c0_g1_i1.p1 TRINITY_DN5237_c0_g1~~TRINITY_DN5237_c0_g1_i1.p1  ORF type:complete len:182 (-),score=29.27 TRINITY_DN5237_c0_g1_i1:133-678(-)
MVMSSKISLDFEPPKRPPTIEKTRKTFRAIFLQIPGASMGEIKNTLKVAKKQREAAQVRDDYQTVVNINKQIKTLKKTMNTMRRRKESQITRRSSEIVKAKIGALKYERKQEALEENFDRCIEICEETMRSRKNSRNYKRKERLIWDVSIQDFYLDTSGKVAFVQKVSQFSRSVQLLAASD